MFKRFYCQNRFLGWTYRTRYTDSLAPDGIEQRCAECWFVAIGFQPHWYRAEFSHVNPKGYVVTVLGMTFAKGYYNIIVLPIRGTHV